MAKNSLQDLKSANFYKSLFCEFLGTALLVLVACGSCHSSTPPDTTVMSSTVVRISLCFGLSVATIVWTIAHVSGGHINPGVTIGFFVTRKISFLRFIMYVAFQTAGAIVGAYVLKALTPEGLNNDLGSTLLSGNVSIAMGFFIELIITFILVWTVFATCDSKRQGLTGSGPLAIGLSIAMCHLWAIPFTGSGMNPARALGSHVASGNTKFGYIWLYWIGPLIGGALAGLVYDLAFAANSGYEKLKGFLTLDYDDDDYDENGKRVTEANLTALRLKDSV